MNHNSENPDDDDVVPEFFQVDSLTRPDRRMPRKLKYKDKGYQIQKTRNGRKWTLVSYYRSAADMRKAYAATGHKDFWDGYYYRMVFPDGSIVPKRFDDGPSGRDYWFQGRR